MRAQRALCSLLLGLLLHGCGDSRLSSARPSALQSTATASGVTIALPKLTQGLARVPRYISPNARSVALTATPDQGSIYAAVTTCTLVTSGVSTYTLAAPIPVGRTTITITANNGPCTGTGGLGSQATGAVIAQAGPVSGVIVAGQSNNLNGPAFFNSSPVALGVAFDQSTASLTASFSATPNITAFEMDGPNVVMALPATLTLRDVFGNPLNSPDASGSNVTLGTPITVNLTDTSVNAQAGTLRLAFVANSGSILAGPAATAGSPPSVSFTLTSAPPVGSKIVVLYGGATQSTFQSASLIATYSGGTIGSIAISNQSVVSTLPFPYGSPNLASIAVLPGSTLAVGAGTRVIANAAGSALGAGSTPLVAGNIGALTALLPAGGVKAGLYATDANCVNCTATSGGVYVFPAAGATLGASDINGVMPVALSFPNNPFINPVGGGFPLGPVGIAALSPQLGGATDYGSLFVAANNSVYRIDLTATAATSNLVRPIAGSNQPGSAGAGYIDDSAGSNARFNFGKTPFIGMAIDQLGRTLYVADASNNAVRSISLSGSNSVSTIAQVPSPSGIAIDGMNGMTYVTSSANGNVYQINGAKSTVFAGQGTTLRGSIDGFASVSYPVQFVAGNLASAPAGGAPASALANLGLTANTNAAIGGNGPLAAFASPMGIAWDPSTTYFYVVDIGSQTVRRVL